VEICGLLEMKVSAVDLLRGKGESQGNFALVTADRFLWVDISHSIVLVFIAQFVDDGVGVVVEPCILGLSGLEERAVDMGTIRNGNKPSETMAATCSP
jgi:hypothetical protein